MLQIIRDDFFRVTNINPVRLTLYDRDILKSVTTRMRKDRQECEGRGEYAACTMHP